jgi:hypothetical protein
MISRLSRGHFPRWRHCAKVDGTLPPPELESLFRRKVAWRAGATDFAHPMLLFLATRSELPMHDTSSTLWYFADLDVNQNAKTPPAADKPTGKYNKELIPCPRAKACKTPF